MTDNEIIKALECCNDCLANLNVEIIGFTNCLQTGNERLKKLLEEADVNYNKYAKWVYKEAIKEFAERLNEKLCDCHIVSDGEYCGFDCSDVHECVDKLVKEMVGDDK